MRLHYMYTRVCVYLFIYISFYLSVYLICLYYLSIHLPIYLPIYQSMLISPSYSLLKILYPPISLTTSPLPPFTPKTTTKTKYIVCHFKIHITWFVKIFYQPLSVTCIFVERDARFILIIFLACLCYCCCRT